MARVGLFGGSFNPIHLGHLAAAEGVRDALDLDRVVFIPAGSPPHKDAGVLAPVRHRLRMVELAIQSNPAFEVWDFEARKSELAFTIDTVRAWKAGHAGDGRLCFIIGADTVRELASWKDVDLLLRECDFVPVPRPEWTVETPAELVRRVGRPLAEEVAARVVRVPGVDVSSSEIRRRIANGRSVRYLLPDAVAAYVREHGLYSARDASGEVLRECPTTKKPL